MLSWITQWRFWRHWHIGFMDASCRSPLTYPPTHPQPPNIIIVSKTHTMSDNEIMKPRHGRLWDRWILLQCKSSILETQRCNGVKDYGKWGQKYLNKRNTYPRGCNEIKETKEVQRMWHTSLSAMYMCVYICLSMSMYMYKCTWVMPSIHSRFCIIHNGYANPVPISIREQRMNEFWWKVCKWYREQTYIKRLFIVIFLALNILIWRYFCSHPILTDISIL